MNLLLIAAIAATAAAGAWSGSGWYVIYVDDLDSLNNIVAGPFASERECSEAIKPSNTQDNVCLRFTEKPTCDQIWYAGCPGKPL